jgi:hypothetical protein
MTSAAPDTVEPVVCVVPLYQEQDIAAETVRFWHGIAERKLCDLVLLVTTAKEAEEYDCGDQAYGRVEGQVSTRGMVEAELARLRVDPERIRLVHCREPARYRAAQLNLAVQTALDRFHPDAPDDAPARVWIAVYNADSRPDAGTFDEFRRRAAAAPNVRMWQQLADYVVPDRPSGHLAAGNAILQTWWTLAHYVARNNRSGSRCGFWARTSPFSTFGHGEFVRTDWLDDYGGFPAFGYADGLLLGWMCRLGAEPIGLLNSHDVAEVPRTARDLITQQTAWMRGLLNFPRTLAWCRVHGGLRLGKAELAFLRAQHVIIPVAWGLSTPASAAGLITALWRLRNQRTRAADLAALAGLLTYPMLASLIPTTAQQQAASWRSRILAASLVWPLEGLAFWPALVQHLRGDQDAPAKTPR